MFCFRRMQSFHVNRPRKAPAGPRRPHALREHHAPRQSLGTALTYKFNRELSLKGEYRYDQLTSNTAGVNYTASAFLVGLKYQR